MLILSSMSLAAVRTFTVKEGDFVTLKPQVTDPDNDKITYTFSPPLDKKGEWQTTFGDEGEYTVTITADDGTSTTQEEVKIVDFKNGQIGNEKQLAVTDSVTGKLKPAHSALNTFC